MSFVCNVYVVRMYSYVTCMPFVCHLCVLICHPYATRMSTVCHAYVLVCHPHATCMYSYIILMSPLCVLVCHPYITRMYSSKFFIINGIFKTQKLPRGMFFIKSNTQIFMTRYLFFTNVF